VNGANGARPDRHLLSSRSLPVHCVDYTHRGYPHRHHPPAC
jgi:hypothetical protein